MPFCGWARLTLKAQKQRDYSEDPQTLGEHLKKGRKELGLFQREAAEQMGIETWTYINWEKDKTAPVAARFRPVVEFLGYDPTPEAKTLRERLETKRRTLGVTFDQMAKHLGWDRATLTRYLNGTWRMPPARAEALERLLSATTSELEAIYRVPRRLRGERKASRRGPT